MIWRIDDSESYLFGSIHLLQQEDSDLPSRVWEIFNRSSKVVFESDLSITDTPEFTSLEDSDSLDGLVPSDLYSSAAERWNALDIPWDLKSQKPWWAGILIALITSIRNGYATEKGVDRQLWDACEKGTRHVLEDLNVLKTFDDAPFIEQQTMLEQAIDTEATLGEIAALVTAWRSFDLPSLESILDEKLAMLPITFGELLCGRNSKWTPKIIEHIQGGEPTIFVFGALHYVGECAIPKLLEEEGFHTTQIRA